MQSQNEVTRNSSGVSPPEWLAEITRNASGSSPPKALVVLTTERDDLSGVAITRTAAIEAFQLIISALKNPAPIERFDPSELNYKFVQDNGTFQIGENSTCYGSSRICAKEFGGRAVFGWHVSHRTTWRHGKNYMGNIEALAHAVWEPEPGKIVEVTALNDEYPGIFVPHARVKPGCQTGIHFMDSYEGTAGYRCFDDPPTRIMRVRLP